MPAPEQLAQLQDAELDGLSERLQQAEQALHREMAPFQRRLTALGQERAVLETERRRRERDRHISGRRQVREQVKSGEAPSLASLLDGEPDTDLGEAAFTELSFLVATGGEVALGYPGASPPSLQLTNGREVAQASDLRRARDLYRQGWECGVPARLGVRVHTPGTRLERLLAPEELFVRRRAASEVGG